MEGRERERTSMGESNLTYVDPRFVQIHPATKPPSPPNLCLFCFRLPTTIPARVGAVERQKLLRFDQTTSPKYKRPNVHSLLEHVVGDALLAAAAGGRGLLRRRRLHPHVHLHFGKAD